MELQNYFLREDSELVDIGGGLKRRIAAHNENLMCVEIHFDKGAAGALHAHPHEQITYIISGEFEFSIGGKKKILKAGDATYKQPNIEHGAVCLEAGVLLDVFTPSRLDFLP